MSKRITCMIAVAIVLLYVGIASATADVREGIDLGNGPQLADEAVPVVQTGPLQVAMLQGPEPMCPGWHLYTTIAMTNTSETEPLTGIVMSDTAPAGTWVHEPDLEGPIPGEYDAQSGVITWNIGQLEPLAATTISYRLRTYSSLTDGRIITHTLRYSATELASGGTISDTATIDTSVCDPTPTPTSTATFTPTPTSTPSVTPTPDKRSAYLPLVFR